MDIVSKQGKVNSNERDLFIFLSDLRNLEEYIPKDKIDDWEATEETCTIGMPQVGNITLQITDKTPYSLIKIDPVSGNTPFSFGFFIQMKQVDDQDTRIKLTLRADLNMMMKSMFQGPMKKGLDQVVDVLSSFDVPKATE